ncbi:ornithine carbamoyltransferase [Roseateles sp. LKC17W]|uniref:Ornithine carbamoyltransferase n=1 Tax=Pelomonas margarita TaxID=3299031 RepID=A0ABW7FIK0_9BURK
MAQSLLQRAGDLQRLPLRFEQVLQGRRLGLMSVTPDGEDAQLFLRAARGLGAYVALIAPPEPGDGAQQLDDIGRLLGRLYEAVECQGLGAAVVDQLAAAGNLPVFDGLAGASHGLAKLAGDWVDPAPLAQRRCWLVQAMLLATLL